MSLSGVGLSSRALFLLASLIRSWPDLTDLHLDDNDFRELDDGAEPFSYALQSCQQLTKLTTPNRESVSAELKTVLDSVSSGKFTVVHVERQWWDEIVHDADVQQPLDPNDAKKRVKCSTFKLSCQSTAVIPY